MIAKVGSAGHVVESVIQYSGTNVKTEYTSVEEDSKKERGSTGEGRNQKSNKVDRVINASESTKAQAPIKRSSAQKALDVERQAIAVSNSEVSNERDLAKREALAMELSQEAVKITVDDVNKKLAPTGSNVQFSYHEKTGRYSFKIFDNEGNVVKEVPPEKSLDMVAKLFEMAGILVDEKL